MYLIALLTTISSTSRAQLLILTVLQNLPRRTQRSNTALMVRGECLNQVRSPACPRCAAKIVKDFQSKHKATGCPDALESTHHRLFVRDERSFNVDRAHRLRGEELRGRQYNLIRLEPVCSLFADFGLIVVSGRSTELTIPVLGSDGHVRVPTQTASVAAASMQSAQPASPAVRPSSNSLSAPPAAVSARPASSSASATAQAAQSSPAAPSSAFAASS